jgi:regulator of extracellular matrix RemA (YlzA/DUF370 family)
MDRLCVQISICDFPSSWCSLGPIIPLSAVRKGIAIMNKNQNSDKGPSSQERPFLSPNTVRMLKLSILIMTLLIAAGLVALVIGMKRQADKLFQKSEENTEIRYQLSQGAQTRSVRVTDDGHIWIEAVRPDGKIELLQLDKDGQKLRQLTLEQGQ